jgi:hypothetical protein
MKAHCKYRNDLESEVFTTEIDFAHFTNSYAESELLDPQKYNLVTYYKSI